MEYFFNTFFLYSLVLFIAVWIYPPQKLRPKRFLFKVRVFFSCGIIIFFAGSRFFVGNDYENYVYGFHLLEDGYDEVIGIFWEPAFQLLAKTILGLGFGYLGLFYACSVITFIIIFRSFDFYGVGRLGVWVLFTAGLFIMVNDQLRQGIAIGVFIYSTKYLANGNIWRFVFLIFVASLFHYSAIGLISLIFLRKLDVPKISWLFLLLISYLGSLFDIYRDFYSMILSYIPKYGEFYLAREKFFNYELEGSGLAVLFRQLLGVFVISQLDRTKFPILFRFFILGVIIGNLSVGFMPIERFSYYLYYLNIVVLPLALHATERGSFSQVYRYAILCALLIYFSVQNLYGLEKHGAVPYRVWFFEDVNNPNPAYYRQHQ